MKDLMRELKASLSSNKLDAKIEAAIEKLEAENAQLKAELAAMREQKPVAWGMPHVDGRIYDVICNEEHAEIEGQYTVPLYAAPGAKP